MSNTIETDILKAALICVSTEKHRYYLNGIYIDPQGFLVSTDGHRMFVAKLNDYDGETGFIIPTDAVKTVTKSKDKEIEVYADRLGHILFDAIDGTYPDWRRVIPSETSGEVAQFNPAYVGDLSKMAKLLGGVYAHIHHNGEAPAGVIFERKDCFAVLMPVRCDKGEWAATYKRVLEGAE